MTMRVSIIFDANGNAAIETIEKLGKAVKSTGAATEVMGAKSRKAASDTQALATQSGAAQTKVVSLSAAQRSNAATAQSMATANRAAAGNMGNLVAQFNDIGVMMASGQNPLTLALQQGTQISQVIGPMGAAGAVKALGGAFLGMLNPISLVTIGVIAGGAALVQWASSALGAKTEARTFDDILDDLTSTVSDYRSLADLASASTSDLEKRFGSASGKAKQVGSFLAEFARVDAINQLDASVASLVDRFGSFDKASKSASASLRIADIRTDVALLRSELDITDFQAQSVYGSLAEMAQADGIDAQVAAAVDFSDTLIRVFGSVNRIPPALQQAAREAGMLALQAGEITGAVTATNAALATQYSLYGASRAESDAALGTAQAMLDELNEQATLQAIIATFGADSAEAIGFQALAARDVYEETRLSEGMSADMRDRIMEAYDAANGLSGLDIGAGIRGAAADAADLAARLAAISTVSPSLSGEDAAMAVSLTPEHGGAYRARVAAQNLQSRALNAVSRRSPTSGSRGGTSGASQAANEAKREQEAVDRLTEGLEDELAILRELDPIQKEMLRNRETLANASAAERDQIEALIGTRNAETAAIAAQTEMMDTLRNVGSTALDTLRESGGSLKDVFASLGNSLADLIWQATVLGEGPLASILGTSNGGGILDMAIGAIFPSLDDIPAKAAGGKIYGAGTGTSDDVLMWGSNGEFMMTAEATKKYQPILEMMNSGSFPAFAKGGAIGSNSVTSGGYGGPSLVDSHVDVAIRMDNLGNLFAIVERISGNVSAKVVDAYDAGLGDRFRQISADTRAV